MDNLNLIQAHIEFYFTNLYYEFKEDENVIKKEITYIQFFGYFLTEEKRKELITERFPSYSFSFPNDSNIEKYFSHIHGYFLEAIKGREINPKERFFKELFKTIKNYITFLKKERIKEGEEILNKINF